MLTARQLATHASQLMPNGRAAPSSISVSPICTGPYGPSRICTNPDDGDRRPFRTWWNIQRSELFVHSPTGIRGPAGVGAYFLQDGPGEPARSHNAAFHPLAMRLSSVVVAAGLIATVTALAADPGGAPSLAEYIATICSAAFRSAPPEAAPFLSENVDAMTRMMVGMEITPSGDADTDFTAMMIPHHQGAIDMARAELRHGRNEQLRRIAQEIIVTQQQEIAAMRLALGQPLPPSLAAPDQPSDLSAGAPQPMPTPQ
jgi:Domain of unknown function (DUF305)